MPFNVEGAPSVSNFSVPNISPSEAVTGRIGDRMTLLKSLDRINREIDGMRMVEPSGVPSERKVRQCPQAMIVW